MTKVLGIDTGTNSLGWAIVERTDEGNRRLLDKGAFIFPEGVDPGDNGKGVSRAAQRTKFRSTRVLYYRHKLRKVLLLRILIENGLCPPLSEEHLRLWLHDKLYPADTAFMQWQRTDEKQAVNPYHFRHICLHERLDLTDATQRYILGRAIYHLNQRRGFLSNRKLQAAGKEDDKETGKVKAGISQLSEEMAAAGCEFLGDYFYLLYGKGQKIRCRHTARLEHYEKELLAICKKQGLSEELTQQLRNVIIKQRELKDGIVGKCVFEKNKPRCPISHPSFEEFRMLCLLNNIRVRTPQCPEGRPLTDIERKKVIPKFYRSSSPSFDFEDIAKNVVPRGEEYGYDKVDKDKPYLFNYRMTQTIKGCPFTTGLRNIFGEDWMNGVCEVYQSERTTSTRSQIINDVWHALFWQKKEAGEHPEKLVEFAKKRLQLDDEQAEQFAKIPVPMGYAALSLKAINNILPYLRRGLVEAHAILLGNLGALRPVNEWDTDEVREVVIDKIIAHLQEYDRTLSPLTLDAYLKQYLSDQFHVDPRLLRKLYHPSMMETYRKPKPDEKGRLLLGSPRIDSIRNPMVMYSLFRLRRVVNMLLKQGKIDRDTIIHIEFARELNDANKRAAISQINEDNRKEREEARKKILEFYKDPNLEPTEREILKYQLWKEQKCTCVYTGKEICIKDLLGTNPLYDIEHTVPRSRGGESEKVNLTLCEINFNRQKKIGKLPSELSNHTEILQRLEWCRQKYEQLDEDLKKKRRNASSSSETKDKDIQERHKLVLKRNYWRDKYERFTMTEVPEGFRLRQGSDIGIISKYARMYLKTIFPRVDVIKGVATAQFRMCWGLQPEFQRKDRSNHIHHCIDAIVIACIEPKDYQRMAAFFMEYEKYEIAQASCPEFPLPWEGFVGDIKDLQDQLLIPHYTPDNMCKHTFRKVRINGKVVGYKQGDTVRGEELHEAHFYGNIIHPVTQEKTFVFRKAVSDLKKDEVNAIVDDSVKAIVQKAIADAGGDIKKAAEKGIWMNEEKRIPIKKVRYKAHAQSQVALKTQRDASKKGVQRYVYVKADSKYAMAIYEGVNRRGKTERELEFITFFDAAAFYRKSKREDSKRQDLIPQVSEKGYELKYLLKKGSMVLFYEKTPEEIWDDMSSLPKRLYKVVSFRADGRVTLAFHQVADKGEGQVEVRYSFSNPPAWLRLTKGNMNFLVEGYDFRLNELGEIEFLR